MNIDLEYYFIQFLFNKNRYLLYQESRGLYDALFERYKQEYEKVKDEEDWLILLDKTFVSNLFTKR